MYVLVDVLMGQLSKLDPREDHVYMGRPNTPWHSQQGLQVKDGATIAKPGILFDFALGGFYCLSRAMLVSIAPYLGYDTRIEGCGHSFLEYDTRIEGCGHSFLGYDTRIEGCGHSTLLSFLIACSSAKAFADVCNDVDEPDDVTLGIITGLST